MDDQFKDVPLNLAWSFSVLAQAALLRRLLRLGEASSLPAFTAMLVCGLVRTGLLFSLSRTSYEYGLIWLVGEVAGIILTILAVVEVHRNQANRYPTIGRFGWQSLAAIALAGGLVSALSAAWKPATAGVAIADVLHAKRLLLSALLVTLLLSAGLFSLIKIPTPRNLILHRRMFALYLAVSIASAVGQSVWMDSETVALLMLLCVGGCYLVWTCVLSEHGKTALPLRTLTASESAALEDERSRFSQLLVWVRRGI